MTEAFSVRVYVPTAVDSEITEEVKRCMADMFEGYTTYGREGGWISDRGDLIQEDVRVIESVTDGNEPARRVKSMAKYVKQKSDQSMVMWEIRPIAAEGMV